MPDQEPLGLFGVIFGVLGLVMAFFGFVQIAKLGYTKLDKAGYFAHERTVDFYMTGDWLVDENRSCDMLTMHDEQGNPTKEISAVMCPSGDKPVELHNMNVTFHGRLSMPRDRAGHLKPLPESWTCTRHSDGFSCKVVK